MEETRRRRVALGQHRKHRSIVDRQLLIDPMQMYLDSAVGKTELAPDLLVRQSLAYQMNDLAFAVAQHGRKSPEGVRQTVLMAVPQFGVPRPDRQQFLPRCDLP